MTLLLLEQRPGRLPAAEGDSWVREQVTRLAEMPGVAAVRFVPLDRAHQHYDKPFDWLVELDIGHGAVEELVARPPVVELLADFRQLGMQPRLVVADRNAARPLTRAERLQPLSASGDAERSG